METTQDTSVISTAAMEHAVLEHIKQAMRVTLDWRAPEVSLPRKISSLQFTIKSLQRHLERVMSIEEEGGYLAVVEDLKPHLQERLEGLAGEHQSFRARLNAMMPELNSLNEWEEKRFDQVCGQLRQLLADLDQHDQQEVELLQQSLLDEEGGEG
ncbi:MAG: hemerythrin domain-containing protein [Pirellulales bacterium]